jgi:protein involved in polysaccharide export with SLBB domain
MRDMKRIVFLLTMILTAASAIHGQVPSQITIGTDVNEITKRILNTTKYRLTPGDTYQLIIVLGSASTTYALVLQENYDLACPYLGSINVKGMYFDDLRKMLLDKMRKMAPLAEYISLVLQSPARFDVAVFGSIEVPGIVTVNPLARVSDALALAKGVKKGASLRQIQLIRAGKKLSVDLQRYSLEEIDEGNPYLEPGDSIFVPNVQISVSVSGGVRYPGAYELLPKETLAMLLQYAGGILAEAKPGRAVIQRFNDDGRLSQLDVDLGAEQPTLLQDGDRIRVPSMAENTQSVLVTGALFGTPLVLDKPITVPTVPVSVEVPFLPGLTLLTVLENMGGPTPYARAKESVVVRAGSGQRVLVDVETLWATKNTALDLELSAGDMVSVPMVLDVFVGGEVRDPGAVRFSPSFTVSDYIVAAGGIDQVSGDVNAVYFVNGSGVRTRAGMTDSVLPGTIIFVDKNWWYISQDVLKNIQIITAFTTVIIGFANLVIPIIIDFIDSLTPPPPP